MVIFVVIFGAAAICVVKLYGLGGIADALGLSWKDAVESGEAGSLSGAKSARRKRQSTDIGDESPDPYEVRTSSLPTLPDGRTINLRYMPTLGNGYIGTTVYSDAIHLNGLYNGVGSASHRARIPAMIMTRVGLTTPDFERRSTRKFTLNTQDGYFMESIKCEFADIEHRIYVHQKYIRLFVVDIFVRMNPATLGGGMISMAYPSFNSTNDILFGEPRQYRGNWQVRGDTREAETSSSGTQSIHIFYMMPLPQISISGSNRQANYTFIMSIDKTEANARQEFDAAQAILQAAPPAKGNYDLFMEHATEWRKTWSRGRVEVEGSDAQLKKAVRFAQFYILNSLPAEAPALAPLYSDPFYGCGRTSLGRGSTVGRDYQGHVMWDNEIYIMPAVLPFHPEMAKNQLRYRSATMSSAAANAAQFGAPGMHFPWRSGLTGVELSPSSASCPSCIEEAPGRRIFVSASVLWAIRQYHSMTRDADFMINPVYKGCDMSRELAKFLASQAVKSPQDSRYDINGITGPDSSHPNVSNDIFTMVAVSLGLHWARYYSCLCQRSEIEEVPESIVDTALYLRLPFDYAKRTHGQFKGFDPEVDRPIKQADAVMLLYPLNWNYSYDIMKNDLELYETLTDTSTPALTWSWFTIGWKWVNEATKARSYFLKSYKDYLIQPFKIWTENNERSQSDQAMGSVNYLPGMGAFLQSIIYGFAGIRIRPDRLEIHNPMPPPGATRLLIHGFQYLQSNLSFIIEVDRTTIEATFVSAAYPLILRRNKTMATEESISTGARITIEGASVGFFIYPSVGETCPHPRDYTFMPYGYGWWPTELMEAPSSASVGGQFGPVWAIIAIVIVVTIAILGFYCVRYRKR